MGRRIAKNQELENGKGMILHWRVEIRNWKMHLRVQFRISSFEFQMQDYSFSIFQFAIAFAVVMSLTGCRQEMADQTRYEPLEESNLFPDGTSARPLPAGTVARGFLRDDEHLYAGRVNGEIATTFPFPITRAVLDRGHDRYNIYCTPCHDYVGTGKGLAVLRGFRRGPPSFHIDRLREAPPGHFFDVITNGFGAMNDYAMQIVPQDRWAVVAYIRALQLSQNAPARELPEKDRVELEKAKR